ncbi:AAA family ATPase [Nocardia cyriacigeorgica]|uniref:AAA family ATPase n=1 Tax=Nocardia cyriacigeorgica TaxID=135487 RepID=UPI0018958951|nr:AAA family ATPase [Nocardia cyriacigeorgica]MBF6088890.1 AAA family ATPase [Nocardia cyriacigeorgica]
MDLQAALATFDRTAIEDRVAAGESQRRQIVERFPRGEWPQMRLDQYALGAGTDGEPTYCRMLEFVATEFGSIGGGSAGKHIIYRHNSGEWRLAPPLMGLSVEEAWQRLRGEFIAAFEAVEREAFADLDDLEVLASGQALVTKSLAAYFPQHFLPIYSRTHLRSFITLLGGEPDRHAPAWRANRQLRTLVEQYSDLSALSPAEVMGFLYANFDPRAQKRAIWKVAPGENARHWPDCEAGNYICIGWDEVGDLAQYTSDTELKQALDQHRPQAAGGSLRQARELLAFRDLEPGDRIVANQGLQRVLAIGTVSGSYRYDTTRPESYHVVPVDWDTSYARELDEPQRGWLRTLVKVPESRFAIIANGSTDPSAPRSDDSPESPEAISQVIAALDRKGQVILHGPPGTGKTRLALHTALAATGRGQTIGTADEPRAIKEMLGSGRVELVTFHPSYGYEDFVESYKPRDDPDAHGLQLKLTDGLFHTMCTAAADADTEPFFLIIDEINRGDLPRIFGELVTLLEIDKRGLPLRLPISKRTFTVPPNLRIIGTMNTADRSVSHVDAAIRRRFAFVEIGPDPDALTGAVGPLDLAAFLTSLNTRISACLDPDHQIGHAYLLTDSEPVATDEELAAAFYHDIVPLIEDYCVSRVELLRELLGGLVDQDSGRPAQIGVPDLAAALASEFTAGSSRDLDG